jgi:hypothetical protein
MSTQSKMRVPTFEQVRVVGMHFRGDYAKAWAAAVQPGTVVQLDREPENEYDSMAIRVLYQFQHVGYIERGQAAFIAPWMDGGATMTCTVTATLTERNNIYPLVTVAPADSLSEGHPQDEST